MGFKPEKFLKGGEVVRTGIDGIGVLTSQVKKYS
jgi:2-keto-4-pentenoate hydratase/2-oxohepta-3-ene-1,7-dioic acid hydratase in catechol pathway